jgi:excisionase family DNA binding protein
MKTANKLDTIGGYWTIAALAEALGVASRTLDGYIREHKVPITKMGGTPLVRLSDLDGYRARIGNVRKLLAGEQ